MKKILSTLAFVGCLLCGFKPVLSVTVPADMEKRKQDSLRALRLEKVTSFRQAFPGIELYPNLVTGVPEQLFGDLSKGQTKSDPVEAAYEFLEQNKDLYGITNPRDELKVNGVAKDKYGAMVDLKQLYKGVDIYKAGMSVHFTSTGKLKGITGGFVQIPELLTTPSIDSQSAVEIAKRDLEYTPDQEKKKIEFEKNIGSHLPPVSATLVVASIKDRYQLIWIIQLSRIAPPGSWEYRIDALSGVILSKGSTLLEEPFIPLLAPKRLPVDKQKDSDRTLKEDLSHGKSVPDSFEVKQGPVLPLDTTQHPREIPESWESSRTPPSNVPMQPDAFQLKKEKVMRNNDIGSQGKIVPARFHLNSPIDSLIKWQSRTLNKKEKMEAGDFYIKPKPPAPKRAGLATTIQTIVSQDFEGDFPASGSNWYVSDHNGTGNGQYFWDDDDYKAANGSKSAWCARGGANGLDPQFNKYPNNMDSWMVYGPFSLSNASSAILQFNYWCRSETNYDTLAWAVSNDSVNFVGFAFTGASSGWQAQTFDLTNVPYLGDLTGSSGLWFAFIFRSDGTVTDTGAFVDDINLNKDAPAGTNQLLCGQAAGWDGPIVVSNQRGTHTQSQPLVGDTAFIDWGVANLGSAPTSVAFNSRLYIDNSLVRSWRVDPPLNSISLAAVLDFPYVFTSTGSHILRVEHDFNNTINESNEGDNSCQLSISVGCSPGDFAGWGYGVLANYQSHIDTHCDGTAFRLEDFTRQLNNNIHGHSGHMQDTTGIKTLRYVNGSTVAPITDPNNVWDTVTQAYAVDAHVYAGWTYTYLDSALNRNGFDSVGGQMLSITEYPSGILGSARYSYTDHRLLYTAPDAGYTSYAGAIEIVAHEWGHGIDDFAAKLRRAKEPGALNESFCDMFGVSVSYAKNDPDYWQMGEDISSSIRNLSNPRLSNPPQPDTYRDTGWAPVDTCTPSSGNDSCKIHSNSGVPNKMFYLFANPGTNYFKGSTVNGIGIEYAFKVMLRAQEKRYWRDTTRFYSARIGSIQAANDINPSGVSELKKAWDAVGVCYKGDLSENGSLTSEDVIKELNCVYLGTDCKVCTGDLNCNDALTAADAVIELDVVYLGSFHGKPDGCPGP